MQFIEVKSINCPLCGKEMILKSFRKEPIEIAHGGKIEFLPDKIFIVFICQCDYGTEVSFKYIEE